MPIRCVVIRPPIIISLQLNQTYINPSETCSQILLHKSKLILPLVATILYVYLDVVSTRLPILAFILFPIKLEQLDE